MKNHKLIEKIRITFVESDQWISIIFVLILFMRFSKAGLTYLTIVTFQSIIILCWDITSGTKGSSSFRQISWYRCYEKFLGWKTKSPLRNCSIHHWRRRTFKNMAVKVVVNSTRLSKNMSEVAIRTSFLFISGEIRLGQSQVFLSLSKQYQFSFTLAIPGLLYIF